MSRPTTAIIGAGFAGYFAARRLARRMPDSEVVLVNPTDYFLYLPLLPEVSAGVLDPRRVTVSIPGTLPKVRLLLGSAESVDLDGKRLTYVDPEGDRGELSFDRLLLTTGSVNKLLPIPGVAKYAHGFRNIAEALYLRDHITRQIELADNTDNPDERAARLTFVVVGAGYTGTEVTAQGVLMTQALCKQHPRLTGSAARWVLVDTAPRVLPGLGQSLSRTADRVLRQRGVEIRTGTSITEAMEDSVRLSDGTDLPTRSLIWCVGVRPEPLVDGLGFTTTKGRVDVDEYLQVPGFEHVYACGDVAAVPDLTRPGEITPMTAQHAQRQGVRAAENIAASFGVGERKPYEHHDLGFVVDLGGWTSAADPLHVPLSGLPAKIVTRGYHLYSLPGNRGRTSASWLTEAVFGRQGVQLGLVRGSDVPLDTDAPMGAVRPNT
jgi:NADH:ubiquinone reductase (H+-translocating)